VTELRGDDTLSAPMTVSRLQRGTILRAVLVAWVGALTAFSSTAYTREGGRDAKKVYEEATVAFSLGHYDVAAAKYEEAFALRPDPALLYNAAQAYRLAGNKRRALELYRNCVRVFPDSPNAADARNRIATLKAEIENEAPAGGATPAPSPVVAAPTATTGVAPPSATAIPPAALPGANAGATTTPSASLAPAATQQPPVRAVVASATPTASSPGLATVSSAPPAAERETGRPLIHRPWFWVVVGAVVAIGAAAIVLSTRGTTYPDATYGMAKGN